MRNHASNDTNSRPGLPDSLKRKQRIKVLSRVLPCLVLLIIDLILIKFLGSVLQSKYEIGKITIRIVLVIAPFVICGVPFKLIDSFWSGTVSEISVEERIGTESIGGKAWPYLRNDLVLTIIKDNGKKIKYKEFSAGTGDPRLFLPNIGEISNCKSKYRKGETLHKYYGFPHPFSETAEEKICISCGTVNNSKSHVCSFCQCELLSGTCNNSDEAIE